MSVQFKRLSYGFSDLEQVQGQALPKESRALKQWLDNLPRGNAREMAVVRRNSWRWRSRSEWKAPTVSTSWNRARRRH